MLFRACNNIGKGIEKAVAVSLNRFHISRLMCIQGHIETLLEHRRSQSDITWEAPAACFCQMSSTGRFGMFLCIGLNFVILTSSSSFIGIWNFVSVEPSDGLPVSSRLLSPLLSCLLLADILDIDNVRWNALFEVHVV